MADLAGETGDYLYPVKRRAVNQREQVASGGVYTGADLVWLLPAAVIPAGLIPKPADVIVDDEGTRWTALSVERNKNRQTWRLTTRNLALAHQLDHTIDIQRADLGTDAAGGLVRFWPDSSPSGGSTPYAGISARVQLKTKEEVDQRGMRGFKETYEVTVDRQVKLTTNDRIKWTLAGDMVYLDISGLHNPELIDQLPVIDAARMV